MVRQQQLLPKGTQYQTVELEKGIYYVFQNFVSVIDSFNSGTVDFYMRLGTAALDGAGVQKFLILICICIGTLFITLLLVSPVSFKIRRQKYQVLLFFLELSNDITNACLVKSQRFEDKFSAGQLNDEDEGKQSRAAAEEDDSSQSESELTIDSPAIPRPPSRQVSELHDEQLWATKEIVKQSRSGFLQLKPMGGGGVLKQYTAAAGLTRKRSLMHNEPTDQFSPSINTDHNLKTANNEEGSVENRLARKVAYEVKAPEDGVPEEESTATNAK